MLSTVEWREVGRREGEVAGSGEIIPQGGESWTFVEPFATGHAILNSTYTLVRRPYGDFPSDGHRAAWLAGVLDGINESGAWMGYLCTIDGLASGLEPGQSICVFVTTHPSNMGFTPD